jgi:hypothetical protein
VSVCSLYAIEATIVLHTESRHNSCVEPNRLRKEQRQGLVAHVKYSFKEYNACGVFEKNVDCTSISVLYNVNWIGVHIHNCRHIVEAWWWPAHFDIVVSKRKIH